MRWRLLRDRLRALFGAQRVHDEIDEEMQFHIDMRARELTRAGLPADEAARQARRSFGSTTRFKEVSYDVRGGGWVEALWRDVAYAARSLRKQPLFSSIIVVVIGIGVGANAAVLGVADHVLWRKLPVRAPEQLVRLTISDQLPAFSYGMLRSMRTVPGFTGVLARWRQSSTFTVGQTSDRGSSSSYRATTSSCSASFRARDACCHRATMKR